MFEFDTFSQQIKQNHYENNMHAKKTVLGSCQGSTFGVSFAFRSAAVNVAAAPGAPGAAAAARRRRFRLRLRRSVWAAGAGAAVAAAAAAAAVAAAAAAAFFSFLAWVFGGGKKLL